ncbi:hypothetical protein D3P08_01590 [Paenibacillus nanensis]|uniref:DUF5652 domain-containing protein n=1 Tax=Paenibacillus nanensis TaxID=393251 RepID=A0A3A1VH86_9BACL|nr:hypothetical protein D3P08_01590 [Paenibacillus nanensis]
MVKATLVDLYLGVFFILCWIYFRERSLVKVLLLAPLAFVFGNAVIFLYIFFSIRKYDYDNKKWLTGEKQQRQ